MKYCADTWLLLKIADKDKRALELVNSIKKGKDKLVVPVVTVLEIIRKLIQKSNLKASDEFIFLIDHTENISVIDVDLDLAKKAGKLSASYGIPSIDAIIAQTCISEKCVKVLTDDRHFDSLHKKKVLKKHSW